MKYLFGIESIFLITVLFFNCSSKAAAQWVKNLGGSQNESIRFLEQTIDSGYIVIGTTKSTDGDAIGSKGFGVLAIKLTNEGEKKWSKILPLKKHESVNAFLETADGGFIISIGHQYYSTKTQTTLNINKHPKHSLTFLDKNGNIKWTKSYEYVTGEKIFQTNDDEFTLIGLGIDPSISKINYIRFLHFNSAGEIIWERKTAFETPLYETLQNKSKIFQLPNGCFYFAVVSSNTQIVNRDYRKGTVTSITGYYSVVCYFDSIGQLGWLTVKPGKFANFLTTQNNDVFILRKTWLGKDSGEWNSSIEVDKYSANGIPLFEDLMLDDYHSGADRFMDKHIGVFLTREDELVSLWRLSLKRINSLNNLSEIYNYKAVRYYDGNANILQDKSGNYYLQTLITKDTIDTNINYNDGAQLVISCISIDSLRNCWNRSLGTAVNDPEVISFYEYGTCEFITIVRNPLRNKIPQKYYTQIGSKYSIIKFDCDGNILETKYFVASDVTQENKNSEYTYHKPIIVEKAFEGGILLGSTINDVTSSEISTYLKPYGGEDILLMKISY